MKKIPLILGIIYLSLSAYSQNVMLYDDFEDIRNVNWNYWDDSQGGEFNESVDNPDPSGLNTSATVAKFTKTATSNIYTHASFELEEPIDLLENHIFRFQVYSDKLHIVKLKLEGISDPFELDIEIAEANVWQQFEYDFSEVANVTDYNKVVIFFNCFNQETATYYLDNFEGPSFDTSPKPLSALTNEEGNQVEVTFSKNMNDPSSGTSDFILSADGSEITISSAALGRKIQVYWY